MTSFEFLNMKGAFMSTVELSPQEQWLADRRKGIGGSDAPTVLGENRFTSRYELWAEKTGQIEPDDLSDNEAVEFGHKLERIVLETLAERTGRTVDPWPQTESVQHPTMHWMRCTPDGIQIDAERGMGLVQAKTTSAFLSGDWSDEPPLSAQIQVQHEMEVMGKDWATLCVIIGGQSFKWFDIERNDRFIDALIQAEEKFWKLVESGTPPDVDFTESCARAIAKLHPLDNGEAIVMPAEAAQWDTELTDVKVRLKELEGTKRELESHIKAAIGDNTIGVLPDGSQYTWKTQTRGAYEVKDCTYRVLRRSKGGK